MLTPQDWLLLIPFFFFGRKPGVILLSSKQIKVHERTHGIIRPKVYGYGAVRKYLQGAKGGAPVKL